MTDKPAPPASATQDVCWLAETTDQSHRYLTPPKEGEPVCLTADPLKAHRFESRDLCLTACTGSYVRGFLPPLMPVEHSFMKRWPTENEMAEEWAGYLGHKTPASATAQGQNKPPEFYAFNRLGASLGEIDLPNIYGWDGYSGAMFRGGMAYEQGHPRASRPPEDRMPDGQEWWRCGDCGRTFPRIYAEPTSNLHFSATGKCDPLGGYTWVRVGPVSGKRPEDVGRGETVSQRGTMLALLREWSEASHYEAVTHREERRERTDAFLATLGAPEGEKGKE